jgi:3-phenylpropionate/trans-cinnamate dioxygenase ferredoxin subunit
MYNYSKINPDQLEYVTVGSTEDLMEGERLFVEIDGTPIVIFRIADQLFAIQDLCSHDDGTLGDGELEGYDVICPRHGAHFDIQSGKALAMPAVVDIKAYVVRVLNKQIEVGLPLSK